MNRKNKTGGHQTSHEGLTLFLIFSHPVPREQTGKNSIFFPQNLTEDLTENLTNAKKVCLCPCQSKFQSNLGEDLTEDLGEDLTGVLAQN